MLKKNLVVSEMFYSLQGEGPCVGRPAVFLRLAACNLNCPGFSYKNPLDQTHVGCDTKLVWQKGKSISFDNIFDLWKKEKWLDHITQGAHCIITGGEPLLQQKTLTTWVQEFDDHFRSQAPFIELETNGTILPNTFLSQRINQFNVSPKLHHSGEKREDAYQINILKHLARLPQAIFKFVIQQKNDIHEVINDYQKKFQIPSQRIWLMPEGGTLAQMQPKLAMVAELCKNYQFNFSPRLHIHIWDEATGV